MSIRRCFPLRYLTVLMLVALPTAAVAAHRVDCHVTYGGETRVYSARPVDKPYGVEARPVGSYFLFRPVFQAGPPDVAGIHVYTYVKRDYGPVIIHQSSHPVPRGRDEGKGYGFTGLQRVYEPLGDGELEYWCEQVREGRP